MEDLLTRSQVPGSGRVPYLMGGERPGRSNEADGSVGPPAHPHTAHRKSPLEG